MEITQFNCLPQTLQNLILARWGYAANDHPARYSFGPRHVLVLSSFYATSAAERLMIDNVDKLSDWVQDDGHMGAVVIHTDYRDPKKPWEKEAPKVFRLKPWEMGDILGE